MKRLVFIKIGMFNNDNYLYFKYSITKPIKYLADKFLCLSQLGNTLGTL